MTFMCTLENIYCIWQNFQGGKLSQFLEFLLNHESFPMNYGLVHCNISLQACYHESFPANNHFPLLNAKVFPLTCFATYDM